MLSVGRKFRHLGMLVESYIYNNLSMGSSIFTYFIMNGLTITSCASRWWTWPIPTAGAARASRPEYLSWKNGEKHDFSSYFKRKLLNFKKNCLLFEKKTGERKFLKLPNEHTNLQIVVWRNSMLPYSEALPGSRWKLKKKDWWENEKKMRKSWNCMKIFAHSRLVDIVEFLDSNRQPEMGTGSPIEQ